MRNDVANHIIDHLVNNRLEKVHLALDWDNTLSEGWRSDDTMEKTSFLKIRSTHICAIWWNRWRLKADRPRRCVAGIATHNGFLHR